MVPQEVKDAVIQAYRRSQPGLEHITAVKGTFYYGECDGVFYAGASFTGGAEKCFSKAQDRAWTYVASDGFPRSPRGCAAIPEIPARLAPLWGDCLARP